MVFEFRKCITDKRIIIKAILKVEVEEMCMQVTNDAA